MLDDVYKKCADVGVKEIMEMMGGMAFESSGVKELNGPSVLGQISGTIGFASKNFTGAAVIHFSKETALMIANMIFGIETEEMTSDIIDAVGEVTNLICGRLKTEYTNILGVECQMTVPAVIMGEKYETYIGLKLPSYIYSYKAVEDQKYEVNVELKIQEFS